MMNGRLQVGTGPVRKVPAHFGWVDARAVRDGHLRACPHSAWALYLFLAVAAGRGGASWYSDGHICVELGMDQDTLEKARRTLQNALLVAYDPPVYRVLDVPDRSPRTVSGTGRASGKAAEKRGSGEAPATHEEVRRILDAAFGRRDQA